MKYFCLIFFFSFSIAGLSAQYRVIVLYRQAQTGKSYWCWNTEYEVAEARDRESAIRVKKALNDKYQKVDGMYVIEPNQTAAVYQYNTRMTGFDCSYKATVVIVGHTQDEVNAKISDNVKQDPKKYVSLPEQKQMLVALQPDKEFTVTENGVSINFRKDARYEGPFLFIQNKNNEAAYFVLEEKQSGRVVYEWKLFAGENKKWKLKDAGDYTVYVKLLGNRIQEPQKQEGTINDIQKWIRNKTTSQPKFEIKKQVSLGCMCVRG